MINFNFKRPQQGIKPAYRKVDVNRDDLLHFKEVATEYLNNLVEAKGKDEEHFKGYLKDFLKKSFYGKERRKVQTGGVDNNIDLCIYSGSNVKSDIDVLVEVKKPSASIEMMSKGTPNSKSFQQAVFYYIQEKESGNDSLKNIIVTNNYQFFVFDVQDVERVFYKNRSLVNTFNEWKAKRKTSASTSFMYKKIGEFIENNSAILEGIYFDLSDYRDLLEAPISDDVNGKLLPLFKIFSPEHLVKKPFANDSNSLDKGFYNELLHIIGLKEDNSSGLIQRLPEGERHSGSLIESTINVLKYGQHMNEVRDAKIQYGQSEDEQLFGVALELVITWMNRVLFLKLMEAQLVSYHSNDEQFKFLSYDQIDEYDELNKLFFWVLALKPDERSNEVQAKFSHIPYLNSSLFDSTALEKSTIQISGLDDKSTLKLASKSILKKGPETPNDKLNTLEYLLKFLDAYNFSAETAGKVQTNKKRLINASVLGLIFEKINGYKDGSFFTPGFITEYMARETLRKAVVDKFNETYGWDCKDFENDLAQNKIADISRKEANRVINSIKICDPAVGSGHFLVSCLNELIAIKSDLKIFLDHQGKPIRDLNIEVDHDELAIEYYGELFEYKVKHGWKNGRVVRKHAGTHSQLLQETLFHEKKEIIENCLFGVDINLNSVKICRLRLWIELLKHAYYRSEEDYSELEVLPNIDINIKQGNSLVSRFQLDEDLSAIFKNSDHSLEDYKQAVRNYRETKDRSEKQRLQKLINDIKAEYSESLLNNKPINKDLSKARAKYNALVNQADIFGKKASPKEILDAKNILNELEEKKAKEDSGIVYREAFEWRFEFPEVLEEDGGFLGFDLIIANPPYVPLESFPELERNFFREEYSLVERKFETSVLFLFRAFELSKANSPITFIAPTTWETGENYKKLRKYLFKEKSIDRIINLPFDVFEDAYVDTGIFIFSNSSSSEYQIYNFKKKEKVEDFDNLEFSTINYDLIKEPDYKVVLDPFWARIASRLNESKFEKLGDITFSTQGLSGSRYEESDEKPDRFNYPFLSDGQVYNYEMVVNKITYTSLADKKNLEKFYQAEPKLLIRRIVNRRDRLDVGYTERKLVVKKDINPFIIEDNRFLPKYVLGIMASSFISAMYVNTSSIAKKDDFRQTTLTELRNLMIPLAEEPVQVTISEVADEILTQKEANSEADTTDLEQQIDTLVYKLYNLTWEEVQLVDPDFALREEEYEKIALT